MAALMNVMSSLMHNDELRRYIDEVQKIPLLTENEEHSLALKWWESADVASAQQLVKSHLRLVVKMALQFKGYGLPMQDIISEGNLGLMTAVKKFNPQLGCRLATYAVFWIKSSIQNFIIHSWSLVKITSSSLKKKLFFNIKKAQNRLLNRYQGSLPDDENKMVAQELGVSAEDVADMKFHLGSTASLNDSVFAEDIESSELGDMLADSSANQEDLLLQKNEYGYKAKVLYEAMAFLNEREKMILSSRRLSENPKTLIDLSKEYGISIERVRQIEERAINKIKQYAREKLLLA